MNEADSEIPKIETNNQSRVPSSFSHPGTSELIRLIITSCQESEKAVKAVSNAIRPTEYPRMNL